MLHNLLIENKVPLLHEVPKIVKHFKEILNHCLNNSRVLIKEYFIFPLKFS